MCNRAECVKQQERNVSSTKMRRASRDMNGDGIIQIIIRIYVSRVETSMLEAARALEKTYSAHCGGRND
jgi:hypothetical protein